MALRVHGSLLVILSTAALVPRPAAAVVPGGGRLASDCYVVFAGVDANEGLGTVRCTDGDPACDADAACDGTCRFAISLCVDRATVSCAARTVERVTVRRLALERPRLPASSLRCGETTTVEVPARGGGRSGKRAIRVTARALGGPPRIDQDRLGLRCEPCPGGASPPTSTTTTTVPARCSTDADCDDGNACNGAERCPACAGCFLHAWPCCAGNGCMRRDPLDCDDGDACTDDGCDPTSGCTHAPIGGCGP